MRWLKLLTSVKVPPCLCNVDMKMKIPYVVFKSSIKFIGAYGDKGEFFSCCGVEENLFLVVFSF